jgi:hypothetical protein
MTPHRASELERVGSGGGRARRGARAALAVAAVGVAALAVACGPAHTPIAGDGGPPDADVAPDADGSWNERWEAWREAAAQPPPEPEEPDVDRLPECGGTVRGDVVVRDEASLRAVAGAVRVEGSLTVSYPAAATLPGLRCLNAVEGDLVVVGNAWLEYLELARLGHVAGDLVIAWNARLSELEHDGLGRVYGDVRIAANAALVDLGAMQLYEVGGAFVVGGPEEGAGNASLESLDGLEGLQVAGGLRIEANPRLRDTSGLAEVLFSGGRGGFVVRGNASLVELHTSEVPLSLAGDLVIEDNPSLVDLGGGLAQGVIGGSLVVRGQPLLRDLGGLEQVVYVEGNVDVSGNGVESLTALAGLTLIGGDSLVVAENPGLPTCAAVALRDRFVELGWTGSAVIRDNLAGGFCE